jgi:hypothetical protein
MLVAGQRELGAQLVDLQPCALLHEEGMAGEEGRRRQARDRGRGRRDQYLAFVARHCIERRQPFRDQVLMRREIVIGQGLPVRQQMHAQVGREPADFLGEALRFERTGRHHREQGAGPGKLRQRQRVGGGGKRRQVEALARFGQGGEGQQGSQGRDRPASSTKARDYTRRQWPLQSITASPCAGSAGTTTSRRRR